MFAGENYEDIPEQEKNKILTEALLFTQDGKPLIKNVNVIENNESAAEVFGKFPEGTAIIGNYDDIGDDGRDVYSVEVLNTKAQSTLQPIELPTVDLENIVFIPNVMTVGDMPIIIDKSYADKIQYEYEEGPERE